MKTGKGICILIGALVVLFAFTTIAMADSGNSSGYVNRVYVHHGDVVMFDVGKHHSKPACNRSGEEWAVSLKTQKGRGMYAMLLSAALQDIPVTVVGTGSCSAWGDREDVLFMYINP